MSTKLGQGYGGDGAAIVGGMRLLHAAERSDAMKWRLAVLAKRPNSRPLIVPFEVAARATAGSDDDARPECADMDPDLFFPTDSKTTEGRDQVAVVRRICFRCPRRAQCQETARFEEYGIWAGLTASERKLRRSKKKKGRRDDN